ncbi:MAG: DUF861 domain-containing protein [Parcubacteria group bacterium]|nr:DUF861 domain-containing protein [Parcubacteria group bacterium]
MKKLIHKKKGKEHFTKDFGDGTTSDRVILPRADDCHVKVTIFRPKAGFAEFSEPNSIVYEYDETVYLVSGQVRLHPADGWGVELGAGDSYHVPAGVSYGLTAITDCEMVCVFSRDYDGLTPEDD